ncbi:MAG: helix-turn-helix transcriptional regulator [Elusimicrobia bacterium]|nr:helix-turn-helix transcriptional regulator [Elusimicrobiota bacterium]
MATSLKELRLDRGISQRQLADQAGVNASVVHRAERGEDAKLSTWGKLFARAIAVSIDRLTRV